MQLVLLVSCLLTLLQSATALRLSTPPLVNGTRKLVWKELTGAAPIFVDAFFNVNKSLANVILSLSPLYRSPHVPEREQDKWSAANWVCSWTCPSQQHLARNGGTLLLGPEVPYETGAHDINASRVIKHFSWTHHSLVVGCPLQQPSNCSDLVLGVTAKFHDVELYSRRGIQVQETAFVREGTELVMCTMYDGKQGSDLIWPWVKYHLMAGFQQILVYVENTMDKVPMLLNDLVASGHVTLVPFYFGLVSDQSRFFMQAAMEQHCLFQARRRATWVGHSDVDEFFELRPSSGTKDMKQFLRGLPEDTAAVVVESQYWQVSGKAALGKAALAGVPFPCGITCKHPGYFGHARTKWISRPTKVLLDDPHHILTDFPIYKPNPDNILRLNHFRHCHPGGGCSPEGPHGDCAEDTSFLSTCSAAVNAELPLKE